MRSAADRAGRHTPQASKGGRSGKLTRPVPSPSCSLSCSSPRSSTVHRGPRPGPAGVLRRWVGPLSAALAPVPGPARRCRSRPAFLTAQCAPAKPSWARRPPLQPAAARLTEPGRQSRSSQPQGSAGLPSASRPNGNRSWRPSCPQKSWNMPAPGSRSASAAAWSRAPAARRLSSSLATAPGVAEEDVGGGITAQQHGHLVLGARLPPTAGPSCAGTLVVAMAAQRTARHGRHLFDLPLCDRPPGPPDGGSTRWQGHRGRIAGGAGAAGSSGRMSPRCPEGDAS